MALLNFNATKVEPTSGITGLPVSGPGGIAVVITASEIKPTQKGGAFLELTVTTPSGEMGKYRLNIQNENPQTVEIAYKQLSALCHVCGKLSVADSSELHGIPFKVITVLNKNPEFAAKGYTEIKGVVDINGNPASSKPSVVATNAAPVITFVSPTPGSKAKSPWEK